MGDYWGLLAAVGLEEPEVSAANRSSLTSPLEPAPWECLRRNSPHGQGDISFGRALRQRVSNSVLKFGCISWTEPMPGWSWSKCLRPCCAQSCLKSAARNSESSWNVYEITVFYSLIHVACNAVCFLQCALISSGYKPQTIRKGRKRVTSIGVVTLTRIASCV